MKNNRVDAVFSDLCVCVCVRHWDVAMMLDTPVKTNRIRSCFIRRVWNPDLSGKNTHSQSQFSPQCSWAWCSLPGWRWRSVPPRFPSSRACSSNPSPACLLRQTEIVSISWLECVWLGEWIGALQHRWSYPEGLPASRPVNGARWSGRWFPPHGRWLKKTVSIK